MLSKQTEERRTQFVCRRGRARLSAERTSKATSCRGLLRVLLLLTLRALLPFEPVRALRLGLLPLLACVPALPLLPERLGGPWPLASAFGASEGGRRNTLGARGKDLDRTFSTLSSRRAVFRRSPSDILRMRPTGTQLSDTKAAWKSPLPRDLPKRLLLSSSESS